MPILVFSDTDDLSLRPENLKIKSYFMEATENKDILKLTLQISSSLTDNKSKFLEYIEEANNFKEFWTGEIDKKIKVGFMV